MWKNLALFLGVITIFVLGFFLYKNIVSITTANNSEKVINSSNPFSKLLSLGKNNKSNNQEIANQNNINQTTNNYKNQQNYKYPLGKPINILLLGIDRRSKEETSYRSDVMILISINPDKNIVTMVSMPRDLWYDSQRINGIYISEGWQGLQKAVEAITGLKPERYIVCDFSDFTWLVDSIGGLNVTVENTFTDDTYPVDETKEVQTVTFKEGLEKLTGARALIFARSRHGTNGEGSDWMRQKRQHKMLKAMLTAIVQPGSIFNPMIVENAYTTVTTGKMITNIELSDARYLWDFYKDKDKYEILSIFLNEDFIYNPPMEDYGGAWVLVAKDESFLAFHDYVHNKLYGLTPLPVDGTSDNFVNNN